MLWLQFSKYLQFALQNTQSQLRVSCKGKGESFCQQRNYQAFLCFRCHCTVWRALVYRRHKGVPLRFLPLKGLSLEEDLSTSRRRGPGFKLWTPLAVPHTLGRNHPQTLLGVHQLPTSSGAAIHNILDCSWLPKRLENYSKLN